MLRRHDYRLENRDTATVSGPTRQQAKASAMKTITTLIGIGAATLAASAAQATPHVDEPTKPALAGAPSAVKATASVKDIVGDKAHVIRMAKPKPVPFVKFFPKGFFAKSSALPIDAKTAAALDIQQSFDKFSDSAT